MSEPIEYGIWREDTVYGWVTEGDRDNIMVFGSVGAAKAQMKIERYETDRICVFGPDGEPVELEVQQQTGPTPIELLRRYEWVRDTNGWSYCPECSCRQGQDHYEDCELAALLREVGSE
jgi:hypothetical protein